MERVGIIGSAAVGQSLVQGAVAARAIEPLCQLWCIPGFRQNQWTHAFPVFWK